MRAVVRPLVLLFILAVPVAVLAEPAEEPMYLQLLLGQLQLNDGRVASNGSGAAYDGRLDDIPYVGGIAQVIMRDDVAGYGWEGGAFVSWINDYASYYARSDGNGGQLNVRLDNAFWSLETFAGLYADYQPMNRLRFYVSGGPLLVYGVAETEKPAGSPPAPPSGSGSVIVIDVSNSDTDLSAGWYARAGLELRLTEDLWAGLNVRHLNTRLNLSDSIGKLDLDGNQYLFSLTQRF
ncbi:MAG: hypothetical protein PSX71_11845 [bacterium]|nr:hypothetical protein [bacterium]